MVLLDIRFCCRDGKTARAYLGVELELDHVSSICLDVIGVECKRTVWPADLDGVCDE